MQLGEWSRHSSNIGVVPRLRYYYVMLKKKDNYSSSKKTSIAIMFRLMGGNKYAAIS